MVDLLMSYPLVSLSKLAEIGEGVKYIIPLGSGFVCTRTQRCACGNRATLLCDWKVPGRRAGTCDAPLCPSCTSSPAPEKDLCPAHAADWAAHRRTARLSERTA